MKNILIIGSGGREHALVWKASQSPHAGKIYCIPGNAGIAQMAECIALKISDIQTIVRFAQEKSIDLAIVGPETPLIAGMADDLRAGGIPTFGPSKAAAAIEGSKVFAKQLMMKYSIPTAGFRTFDDPDKARKYVEQRALDTCGCPLVVKADGEALGKGVFVCDCVEDALQAIKLIMIDRQFGSAGDRLIIEERLEGQEASLMAFTDGENVLPMTPVQDHKRAYDGDKGPNTGGMGCYSPVPAVSEDMYSEILETMIKPTIRAMKMEGRPYTGLLYTGVILTSEGPKVLEYNARFGDPETQVALPLMEDDIIEVIQASVDGSLDSHGIKCYNGSAVCVVIASGGYPGKYEVGKPISGLQEASELDDVIVFHAGTKTQNGSIVTSGGRVLGVTGIGGTYREAIDRAYAGVSKISFDGMHYRKDIGARAIIGT